MILRGKLFYPRCRGVVQIVTTRQSAKRRNAAITMPKRAGFVIDTWFTYFFPLPSYASLRDGGPLRYHSVHLLHLSGSVARARASVPVWWSIVKACSSSSSFGWSSTSSSSSSNTQCFYFVLFICSALARALWFCCWQTGRCNAGGERTATWHRNLTLSADAGCIDFARCPRWKRREPFNWICSGIIFSFFASLAIRGKIIAFLFKVIVRRKWVFTRKSVSFRSSALCGMCQTSRENKVI